MRTKLSNKRLKLQIKGKKANDKSKSRSIPETKNSINELKGLNMQNNLTTRTNGAKAINYRD